MQALLLPPLQTVFWAPSAGPMLLLLGEMLHTFGIKQLLGYSIWLKGWRLVQEAGKQDGDTKPT